MIVNQILIMLKKKFQDSQKSRRNHFEYEKTDILSDYADPNERSGLSSSTHTYDMPLLWIILLLLPSFSISREDLCILTGPFFQFRFPSGSLPIYLTDPISILPPVRFLPITDLYSTIDLIHCYRTFRIGCNYGPHFHQPTYITICPTFFHYFNNIFLLYIVNIL